MINININQPRSCIVRFHQELHRYKKSKIGKCPSLPDLIVNESKKQTVELTWKASDQPSECRVQIFFPHSWPYKPPIISILKGVAKEEFQSCMSDRIITLWNGKNEWSPIWSLEALAVVLQVVCTTKNVNTPRDVSPWRGIENENSKGTRIEYLEMC